MLCEGRLPRRRFASRAGGKSHLYRKLRDDRCGQLPACRNNRIESWKLTPLRKSELTNRQSSINHTAMNATHISTDSSRRRFLRGLGVSLALPSLECMSPVFARATEPQAPRRMLVIVNNLGLLPRYFAPKGTGRDYTLSPYLELLSDVRDEFTVFSGLSHPGVDRRAQHGQLFPHRRPGRVQIWLSQHHLAGSIRG